VYVSVCVCVGERESVHVCVREKARESARERECVAQCCMLLSSLSFCVSEAPVCVCVCVCM